MSRALKSRPLIISFVAILAILGLAGYRYIQQKNQDNVLTIGINPTYSKNLKIAAEEAEKQGIHVKLVEFSDWSTPNITLSHGDIDANYFQHRPYLENEVKAHGYKFKVVGVGVNEHVGLYSKKYKSLDELPDHASAVLPNDPVNQGRALLLFQQAKLIQLKDPKNYLSTLKDIVSNPKNLKFTEVEGPQLARAVDDADIAFGFPIYLTLSKNIDPNNALVFDEPTGNLYGLLFVTRDDYQDKTGKLAKFIHIFQTSERVKKSIDQDLGANLWYADWKK